MDILKLNECNKEQLDFIESELTNSCLIGIPGGGKTTTIIKKIVYHIIDGKLGKKDFLIITFSKKACHDFIERGNNIIQDIFSKNNVKTIHSLAGTIINKLDKSKSESIEIVICKALNYIYQYSIEELKNIKCLKSLKLIIIDEAQDISEIQYNLAKTIANKLNSSLILVGDPNQNIYQFQNGTDKFLLEHSKNKFYLKQNYRSTPELVDFINALKPWKNIVPDIIPTRESLNKKPILYAGSLKVIVDHMMETIEEYQKEGINLKDIAIIGPVKKSKENSFGKFNNIGLQYFVNYFEDNKIKYIKHYSESTNDCEIVNTKTYSKDNHINLYTIHGSKGLEFKKVFLLNFHTNTYGRNPTSRDYNNFRYLWYVGLSRACDDMIIYTDYTKNVWHELAKCNPKLYKFSGKQLKFIEPIFEKSIKRSSSITELLKTKEIFTEEILFELKNYLNFEVNMTDLYTNFDENILINNFEEYSSLYGKYIEQIFEYLYCIKNKKDYLMSTMTKQFISNRICLSKKFRPYISGFLSKLGKTPISLIEMEFINEIKNDFDDHEKEMYEEVVAKVKESNLDIFSIYVPNELVYDNPDEIYNIADNIDKNIDTFYNLYLLNLYFYQYEHEAKYLWKQKEDIYEKIKSTNVYIKYISEYINTINDSNYQFQININSKYINDLNGIIDAYSGINKEILEFKFVKSVGLTHYLQVFLYNFIKNNSIDKLENMSIINFLEGKKYSIKINNKINSFELLLKLANILNSKIKNLVIVYDLETTGLITENYPEIIDRYFYEINLNAIIDSGLVKPIKPIPEEVSKLTNITDEMLKDAIEQKEFYNKFIELNKYLLYPTYIAHNGNHFDHKIMVHYNLLEYSKVKFLDSRQIILNFAKNQEKEIKGKLTEMYKTVTGKDEVNAHRAGADVHMVIDIFDKLNIKKSMNLII